MKTTGWFLLLMTTCAACVGARPPAAPPTPPPKRAVAPSGLDDALAKYFPPWAQQVGLEGTAVVRFRIDRMGKVTPMRVLEASHPSFGEACMALLGSDMKWEPARNQASGEPIDAIYPFTCRFQFTEPTPREAIPPTVLDEQQLKQLVPRDAAGEPLHGDATVALVVHIDGSTAVETVVAQSDPRFGQACQDLLSGLPRWLPALDKQRKPREARLAVRCEVAADSEELSVTASEDSAVGPTAVR